MQTIVNEGDSVRVLQLIHSPAHPRAMLCTCCGKSLHNAGIDLQDSTLSELTFLKAALMG